MHRVFVTGKITLNVMWTVSRYMMEIRDSLLQNNLCMDSWTKWGKEIQTEYLECGPWFVSFCRPKKA
jgi:hypothetical protein